MTARTPDETKDKLNHGILLVGPVETYGDRTLRYDDGADVMRNSDRGEFRTKEKLEDVHGDEKLVQDDKNCSLVSVTENGRLGNLEGATDRHPESQSWIWRKRCAPSLFQKPQ